MGFVAALQLGFFASGDVSINEAAAPDRADLDSGAWVEVRRGWLLGADTLCEELITGVPWAQNRRRMYDRVVDDPRLSWRQGTDVDLSHDGDLPHGALETAGHELGRLYQVPLAGPSLNYYRDGRDSVAFHADRELRHLSNTLVVIVTLGATRPFLLRPLGGGKSIDFRPASGDLLVMGGACQALYEHCVPKIASAGPRISASWRWASQPDPPGPGRGRR